MLPVWAGRNELAGRASRAALVSGGVSLRTRLSLLSSGMKERIRMIRRKYRTYTAYSIACAVVWAVILAVASMRASDPTRHTLVVVLGGWWIGWLSATIARAVYPPPKHRKPVS